MSKPVPYGEAQVRHWLHWLAHNMQTRNETVFMVEDLQPSWLSRPIELPQRLVFLDRIDCFVMLSGMLLSIPMTLFLIQRFGFSDPETDLTYLLILGLVMSLAPAIGRWLCVCSAWSKKFVGRAIAVSVVLEMLFLSMSNSKLDPFTAEFGFYVVLAVVVYAWIAVSRAGRSTLDFIQPVESVSFSPTSGWTVFRSDWSWYYAFVTWYVYWPHRIVKGIQGSVKPNRVSMKIKPNLGIWLSLRNAIQFLIPVGLLFTLIVIDSERADWWKLLAVFVTPIALYLAIEKGTTDFVDHFLLRLMMRWFGYAPLDYVHFLDFAANELGLLQKVGGGYMFMHRSLLEYFATQPDPPALKAMPMRPVNL